jgi:hypothetical protein
MTAARGALRVVGKSEPERPATPENLLGQIVPELIRCEAVTARLRQLMLEQGRALAAKRGVAFIREEQVRQEFKG